MNEPTRHARNSILLLAGAIFLAFAATACTYLRGDVIGGLFEAALTIKFLLALLVWFLVAWVARRVTFGSVSKIFSNTRPAIALAWLQIGLMISISILVSCWLIALISKLSIAYPLVEAAILIMMTSIFVSLVGNALMNTMLVIRHSQQRSRL